VADASTPVEPAASKVVNVQIAWGPNYDLPLEDVVAGLKRILTEGVDELAPAKRVTVMDQYWLIDGERVTPAMLAERQTKAVNDQFAANVVLDNVVELPVDPRETRKRPGKGATE
jgi:hypothetical protein